MKRYPLLLATAAYIGGIVAAWGLPVSFAVWPLIGGLLALIAVFARASRPIFVYGVVAGAGAILFSSRTQITAPNDLRLIAKGEPELAVIKGILIETPSYTRYEQNGREHINSSVRLDAREIIRGKATQAVTGRVLVTTPAKLPENIYAGQTVTIEGVLGFPKGAPAEGLFNYRKYLATQRVYFQLRAEHTNDWSIENDSKITRPLSDRFLAWGQNVLAIGLPAEDEPLHLLWAMTLGWRPGLNADSSTPFIRTGTMHIFAISGLHIALIAAILVQFFRFLRVPRAGCALLIIPLIWFYTAATGWQPSAIRSTIMSSVIVFGWSLKRPSNLLNSLAASAFIILLWQPEQLFQASFQLSFFVVLSLALVLPFFERLENRLWEADPEVQGSQPISLWLARDPLLPEQLESRWKQWVRRMVRILLMSLGTTSAAWIGSLPLIMYYFSIISWVSLFANLVIVPLSSLALTANLAALCTNHWWAWATSLFNHTAWGAMSLMNWLSNWLADFRPGYYYVRPPGVLAILCYFLFLIPFCKRWFQNPAVRTAALGAIPIGLALYFMPVLVARRTGRLTVLPVGGGVIVAQDFQSGRISLFDTADLRGAKAVVSPFLHAQGINKIDTLFLTHGSTRHAGGLPALLHDTPPCQILSPSQRLRSKPFNQSLEAARTNAIPITTVSRCFAMGTWRVLHPPADTSLSRADDKAMVIAGEYNGWKILYLSQLGKAGQQMLIENVGDDLQADIVISGLPLHDEPLSEDLLEIIDPSVVILCTSEYPAAMRDGKALRQRLEKHGRPVFYSDESEAVTILCAPGLCRVSPMIGNPVEWRAAGHRPRSERIAAKRRAPERESRAELEEDDSAP